MHKSKQLSKSEREKYWKEIFKDWLDTGLTGLGYCKVKKIPTSCFYQWRNRLLPDYRKVRRSQGDVREAKNQFFIPIKVRPASEYDGGLALNKLRLHYPNGCYT